MKRPPKHSDFLFSTLLAEQEGHSGAVSKHSLIQMLEDTKTRCAERPSYMKFSKTTVISPPMISNVASRRRLSFPQMRGRKIRSDLPRTILLQTQSSFSQKTWGTKHCPPHFHSTRISLGNCVCVCVCLCVLVWFCRREVSLGPPYLKMFCFN